MSFKVTTQLNSYLPKNVRHVRTPISFHRVEFGSKLGVLTLVQHSACREAYFYPNSVIKTEVGTFGGPHKYVYGEGFDPPRVLQQIEPFISQDNPNWLPRFHGRQMIPLDDLLIWQPGVHMWRLLYFAMDHSPGLGNLDHNSRDFLSDAPPSFGVFNSKFGLTLIAGNHRAAFALESGVPAIPLVQVHVGDRAFSFMSMLKEGVSEVEQNLGDRGVLALRQSFINQVEAQG